jgi:DNA-binding NarL/FixJ family response regulator
MVTRIDGTSRASVIADASRGARALIDPASSDSVEGPLLAGGDEATIAVVDRRALFRDCLVRSLQSVHEQCRILAFASLSEWLTGARRFPSPALLVVCVSGGNSIDPDVRRELAQLAARGLSPPALIISDTDDFDDVCLSLRRAVQNYLARRARVRIAVRARQVDRSSGAAEDGRDDPPDARFSARQMAILQALRQGKGSKEIAGALRVRQRTVRVHVRNIMKRLNARSLAEVASLADRLLAKEECLRLEGPAAGSGLAGDGKDQVMHNSSGKLRVVVIDPQKLRQAGLVRLLAGWADANGLEVTTISRSEELLVGPDCAIVVLNVGGASLLEPDPQLWIKRVRTKVPDVPLVILSDREDRREILAAFGEGATGFIATSLDPSLALEALTFLLRGGSFFPLSALLEESRPARTDGAGAAATSEGDQSAARLPTGQGHGHRSSEDAAPTPTPFENHAGPPLTPRQAEVLERLREGKSNKLIARELNMTEATVKVHVRQIMRKFGATNRTQAVLCAARLSPPESDDRTGTLPPRQAIRSD